MDQFTGTKNVVSKKEWVAPELKKVSIANITAYTKPGSHGDGPGSYRS